MQYQDLINQIQDYIAVRLDQPLSLERLAERAGLSPYHFHRVFRSVTGEPPSSYVRRLRMEKACRLLRNDEKINIISIATACGFSTHSAFSKAFKSFYQIDPSGYRSKNGTAKGKDSRDSKPEIGYTSDTELKQLYVRRKEMNVRIEEIPPYRIAYMRRIGAYGDGNRSLMQRLKRWALTRGLLDSGTIILGIAHDDPSVTPAEHCRYDTGIVLPRDYIVESGVNESCLEGGLYAVLPLEHTEKAIRQGWKDIFDQWLEESGYVLDERPAFERYGGLAEGDGLEPVRCEICLSVRKA